ncbi:MAG: hypothetical protein VKP70_12295 [Cyanobacteriota bacterium]|nr:hypothetical protein [Cyanobacteriota bacterium]
MSKLGLCLGRPARQDRLAAVLSPLGMAVVLLGPGAPPAGASSPEAWRAYDREVRSACLKATGLLQPRILGERIDVPVAEGSQSGNTLLISAFLVEGRYPQAHMGGKTGRDLCLFEQRTRRATVGGAEHLDRPRPTP